MVDFRPIVARKRSYHFYHTPHFLQRQTERGFTLADCEATVLEPDEKPQEKGTGKHGGYKYAFLKTIRGSKFRVVAEIKRDECWLLTAHPYDRYV